MRRSHYIGIILIIIIVIAAYMAVSYSAAPKKSIKIFCAGSLKIPLEKLSQVYEEKYNVNVMIESSGSVEAVRKVVDVGRIADIVAVADYRLLGAFMYPKYTDWYIAFASNEIVLVYTNKSKYSDIISNNPGEWYKILMRNDVKFGFSNPNKDPCGYRSVGIIGLLSLEKNNMTIFEKLVKNHTNITYKYENGTLTILVPADLKVKSGNLIIRAKSVDLVSLLEAGSIDYVFEYKSVAVQHNLNYIKLSDKINLSNPKYDSIYSKVAVKILIGTNSEKTIYMKSIVYGITIPKNAKNYKDAIKFVKLLLSDEGRKIFEELGQPFLEKPMYFGNVPKDLII